MERVEAAVWRDELAATPPAALDALGLTGTAFSGGLAVRCRALPTLIFNRAFGFGLEAPFGAADLERIVEHYPADAACAILPGPACVFEDAGAWLDARGMRVESTVVSWWRALDDPLPESRTGLRIADVARDDAAKFGELCARIFGHEPIWPVLASVVGRPGWRHFVALDEDRPVAVGTLAVQGPAAWLGSGGTLESHRGRGAQSALIAHRLAAARAMGAAWARCDTNEDLLDRPNPSFRNVRRAGFTPLYRRARHARLADSGRPPG
jgi:GNAT superfamily N-acetyltransferase